MTSIRLAAFVILLVGRAALADTTEADTVPLNDAAKADTVSLNDATEAGTVHLNDATWVKDAADRLARCAGTYGGVAQVMRKSGREEAADYAEQVGSGAMFAAYLLLTSPVAITGKVLDKVDPMAHIDALEWGGKRNFIMMDAQGDAATSEVLRACIETSSWQSSILLSSTSPATVTAAR